MTTPDTRPLLDRALDQAGRLVLSTAPADGTRPTPCQGWDVTALTGHLLAVVRRIGAILNGADPAVLPRIIETTDTDTDAAWERERSETRAVLATDDVLDQAVVLPWGTVTGWQAIASFAGELTTHAWDLAVATGRTHELDDSLAAAVLPGVRQYIPAERGEHVPFAPVVEVGTDATAYEQLVAWEGRDPNWQPA
ncbi:MAG: TIGR03086 family metal-binding protein [Dermatophilaceae bacterium]